MEDFEGGPVIAINYAVQVLETLNLTNPVYSMQKDQNFCKTKYPTLAHYHESGKNGWGSYVFDNPSQFSLSWNMPSLLSAVKIAELMGCIKCVFLCCDAVSKGDLDSYENGEIVTKPCRLGYPTIGALVKQLAERIRMPIEWRLPYPQRVS